MIKRYNDTIVSNKLYGVALIVVVVNINPKPEPNIPTIIKKIAMTIKFCRFLIAGPAL